MKTIGPYHVRGVLGRGGMGVVYRGVHAETGEEVAIKTAPALSEPLLRSLRREIHALSQVRHPGVVRILAQGAEDGRPWYAMELIHGVTLRQRLADDGPPPAELVAALLRRLCAALAALHAAGFVHRDLKPENILLREGDAPVIVDFGIAARFSGASGREVLEIGGSVAGSAPYMSPEQIRGDLVDARSDLYSLGCILYEGLTGRPPFEAPSPREVFFKHLTEVPRPPAVLRPGVSPALAALALRLLEKRPQDRLGYAEDVAAELAAVAPAPPDEPCPHAQPYLYRPSFLGRHDAVWQLQGALRDARAGLGREVLLGGESGVGKTRLAMEIAALAYRRGFTVISGECVPLGAGGGAGARGAPLHPLRPLLVAIGDHCRREGPSEAARVLGGRARVLAAYEPALADLADPEAAAPELPAPAARERAITALKEAVLALAEAGPTLLLLDDLQWADELSLRFLVELSGADLDGRGLLLLGTYRAEEVGPGLREALESPGVLRIDLGGLDRASMRQMACDMLALPRAPEAFLDFLTREAAGNPFFLSEYLRAAIDEGLLQRVRGGAWQIGPRGGAPDAIQAALPLPGQISALIGRRLAGLGEGARALARVAAVLGREIDEEALRRAAGLDDAATLDALAELRRRHVLEEDRRGALRFVHDRLRELVYGEIPAPERRDLHGRVGRAIEDVHPGPDRQEHLEALAHHFGEAGEARRAADYAERAGDKAAAAFALDAARRQYRRALDLMAEQPSPHERVRRRVEVALKWADACLYEPSTEQIAELEATRDIAARAGDARGALRCQFWVSWIEYALGDHRAGIQSSERAAGWARALGEERLLSHCHFHLGQNHASATDYDRAIAYLRLGIEGEERSRPAAPSPGLAYAHGYLGLIHGDRGEFPEAYASLETARAVVATLGRRSLESSVLTQLAMVQAWQGAWGDCEGTARRNRAEAERLGAPYVVAMSRAAEGYALFHLGREAEGLEGLREAARWFQASGIRLTMSWCCACLAEALALAGRGDEAEGAAKVALERGEAWDRVGEGMAHRALAIAAAPRDLREARRHLARALRVAHRKRSRREEALARLCAAGILRASPAEARRELAIALPVLRCMGMRWHAAQAEALSQELADEVRRGAAPPAAA